MDTSLVAEQATLIKLSYLLTFLLRVTATGAFLATSGMASKPFVDGFASGAGKS